MANTIKHKRSSTAGATPSSGSLVAGELAINTADGKVFTKKDNGTVVRVGGEFPTVYSGTSTPSNSLGANGDLYFKY
jgi:hypothetical protein